MMKLFVGYGRESASPEFAARMKEVLQHLRADREHELLEFDPIGSDTQKKIDQENTACLRECDLFIAMPGESQLWVGAYFERAMKLGKPCLVLMPERLRHSPVIREIFQLFEGAACVQIGFALYCDEANGEKSVVRSILSQIRIHLSGMRPATGSHVIDRHPLSAVE